MKQKTYLSKISSLLVLVILDSRLPNPQPFYWSTPMISTYDYWLVWAVFAVMGVCVYAFV